MNVKVTVILLTFRRPQLLRDAIESVLAQTYEDFVVLVCDDASGYETEAVTAEFSARDRRVVYCQRPTNVGPMENMCLALRALQTPYFALLSDDDQFCPDFLTTAVAGLALYPEAVFCGGQTYEWERATGRRAIISGGIKSGYYLPEAGFVTLVQHFVGIGACLFRTRYVQEEDFFCPNIFPLNESYTLFKLARRLPFVFEARPFHIYDTNPTAPHRDRPRQGIEAVLVITMGLLATRGLTAPMRRALLRWCRNNLSKYCRRAMDRAGSRLAEQRRLAWIFHDQARGHGGLTRWDVARLWLMFTRLTAFRLAPQKLRGVVRKLSGRS